MEISDFVNMDFLAGFTGTMVCIELMIYCTKELPIIKNIPTRIYTFILTIIHLSIVKHVIGTFTFTLGNVYLIIINSLLISAILCGGYDVVLGNVQIPQGKNQQKNVDMKTHQSNDNEEDGNGNNDGNLIFSEKDNIIVSNRGRNSNINDKTN